MFSSNQRLGEVGAALSLIALAVAFGAIDVVEAQSPRSAKTARRISPEDENLFNTLDTNEDGELSMDDANDRNRRMFQEIYRMSKKPTSESISKSEFQKIAEEHRRNARGRQQPQQQRQRSSSRQEPRQEQRQESQESQESEDAEESARPAAPQRKAAKNSNARSSRRGAQAAGQGRGIQGVWPGWVVHGRGENPNTGHMELELRIDGNTITSRELGTRRAPGGLGTGRYEITGDASSGTIDAVGTSGQYQGIQYLGIYEVEGDTLRWCSGNRNRPRPRDFATDRGNYLMILTRAEGAGNARPSRSAADDNQ